MIKVTIFNENYHELTDENTRKMHPNGIHGTLAQFLKDDDISVKTVTMLDDNGEYIKECGVLGKTPLPRRNHLSVI